MMIAATASLLIGCAADDAQKREVIRPGQTRLRIASFEINGNDQFDEDKLKQGLSTREDPGWRGAISWLPVIGAEHQYFNRINWRRDLERIRTFYKRHGYFNARVVSENIVESREDQAVRISIRIAEGQPTRITEQTIEGLEPLPEEARQEIVEDLPLNEGDIFTEQDYRQTRSALVGRLQRLSYAYAQISGRAVINPQTNQAEVFFFLDPGPRARFGEIHIVGTDEIDEKFVRNALPIEPGEPYSAAALEEAQVDVYNLGVFSLVSVLPAHQASGQVLEETGIQPADVKPGGLVGEDEPTEQDFPERPTDQDDPTGPHQVEGPMEKLDPEVEEEAEEIQEDEFEAPGPMGISDVLASAQKQAETRVDLEQRVPIVIQLKEARLWNVEVGAGLSVETNRSDIHGQANWSSRNFLGGLRKLEHFNSLGYAWASNVGSAGVSGPFALGGRQSEAANQGVFFESRLEFRQPQFIERKTTFRSTVRFRRAIEVGYTVWNPQATVGLERRFFERLTIGLNYHTSFYRYENVGDSLLAAPTLGVDFNREYLLEWLEQRIALDLRDNPLNPRSGFYSSLSVQEAGSYVLGGDFNFLKVIWANEAYIPLDLLTQWVFATRFRVGTIYNNEPLETNEQGENQADPIPIDNRLYGGGSNSLRGLGRNNLSFFRVGTFSPDNPAEIETVEVIPVGGLTLAEASIEPRFRLMRNLADVGPLWGLVFLDVATVLNEQLFYSTKASESLDLGTADLDDIRSSLISAVGAGAFWLTPVGPVRADLSVTLNDLSDDPRFRTCGPASRVRDEVSQTGREDCDFLPVERDPVQEQINLDYSFFIGVGHSF
jgi:outer membrane protein assembly factor BamA